MLARPAAELSQHLYLISTSQVREASDASLEQQQELQQLQSHLAQLQDQLTAASEAKLATQEAAHEKLVRLGQLEGESLDAADVQCLAFSLRLHAKAMDAWHLSG